MATVSRTFFAGDRDDDGPTAVRDFPAGCICVPRRFQESTNRPVEATDPRRFQENYMNRPVEAIDPEGNLPDNFYDLCPRDQFFERCGLFHRHLRHYSYLQRPDLEAMKQMNIDSSSFKFEGLGPVPGVEVGDTFDCRAEMFVVGLHRMQEAGIACVNLGNETIACSVVVSGGYEDNVDLGDVIYYSGHGGNDEQRVGKKEDQELKGGNMGLWNSLKQKESVRVIRGLKTGRTLQEVLSGKNTHKKYSYDGLYTVDEHELVKGKRGHKVHRFKLIRQPGQSALDMKSESSRSTLDMNRVGYRRLGGCEIVVKKE